MISIPFKNQLDMISIPFKNLKPKELPYINKETLN